MAVECAFGACKRRGFEHLRSNKPVMARGDAWQVTEEVRHLERTLDAEDAAEPKPESSGEESATGWGRRVIASRLTHIRALAVFR